MEETDRPLPSTYDRLFKYDRQTFVIFACLKGTFILRQEEI